jgi:hypothetical protein
VSTLAAATNVASLPQGLSVTRADFPPMSAPRV